MTDIRAWKKRTRRSVVARVAAMDPADRQRQEMALGEALPGLPGFAPSRSVLLYASAFPEEVPTSPWIDRALTSGKRVFLPRVDPAERRLRLFEVSNLARDLIEGHKGIPEPGPDCREVEPAEVDWALVPGLAFDGRGYRLGRGAGHYDRLLPMLRPEVQTWALILDAQWVEEVPVEPHDRALSGVADHRRVVTRTI